MIDDERIATMLDSFMGQWLGTRDVGRSHKMDAKIFPEMDDELAEAFRSRWLAVRREEARQIIKRGKARGEIRADIDPEVLLDALYGPLYFRLLIGHAPLTPGYADKLVRLVMSGLDS